MLTLAVGSPVARLRPRPESTRIPILMYHGISREIDATRHPYYRTVTSPETFARHIDYLERHGYTVLTLSAALRRLAASASHPIARPPRQGESAAATARDERVVALTFDDGLRTFATEAFPILAARGFGATVFLSTGYLGKAFPTGEACLHPSQVSTLAAHGIEFGSHTVTHPQLSRLSTAELRRELIDSRAAVEHVAGRSSPLFSYPFAFPEEDAVFTQKLRGALLDAGYEGGVTTIIGRASALDDPLLLKRLPINDLDDDLLLRAKLEGAYDWLHAGQLLYKRLGSALAAVARREK